MNTFCIQNLYYSKNKVANALIASDEMWDDFLKIAHSHFEFEINPRIFFYPAYSVPNKSIACSYEDIKPIIQNIKNGGTWFQFFIFSKDMSISIEKRHDNRVLWREHVIKTN